MAKSGDIEADPGKREKTRRKLIAPAVFERVVQKSRVAMVLADPNLPDCPLVFINPAFAEMTGYDENAALGRNCRFLQGPGTDPEALVRIRQAVAAQIAINVEMYNYKRDGSGFWNGLFISPVHGDDGKLIYFFASQIDISVRREALRRETLRVESMAALASGVAHEFNNLMTVVLGSVERANHRAVDDIQRRQLERADWGAQRAGKLAGELLSLSRRQNYESRVVDLNETVQDFADTLRQALPVSVAIEINAAAEAAPVRVDPDQLALVLLNLVRNAVDAMPHGGTVKVATRVLSPAEAISKLGGRMAAELTVSDSGEGMPPDVAARATELFFTTKSSGKGTGLGLFLALEFIDKCGGQLSIESEVGCGTRVALVFPYAT